MNEISVGDRLYGFCGGTFGRDSYGDKTVLAGGCDWIVAREDDTGVPVFGGPLTQDQWRWLRETQDVT